MNIYFLQIFVLCLVLLAGIFLLRLAKSIRVSHRIAGYSLNLDEDNVSLLAKIQNGFWNFISHLSKGLSNYKIIDKLANKYDKYILEIKRNQVSKVDYFTIKLLLIILLLIISLVLVVLQLLPSSILVFILAFMGGYFLPDLFWKYLYIKITNKIVTEVYLSTKYISYALQHGYGMIDAVKYSIDKLDGEIVDELQKILRDLRNNITIEMAFLRFYQRSKLSNVKYIYDNLSIASSLNISYAKAFSFIETNMSKKEIKNSHNFKMVDVYNYLFLIVLCIPVLVWLFGSFINPNYFEKLFVGNGRLVVMIIVVLYSIYIYIVKNALEVSCE